MGIIKQEVYFECTTEKFFDLYLSKEHHGSFTESEVEISVEIGDHFSAYDGYCEGKNIEILPYTLIKQTWRSTEEDWEPDQYSTIVFKLEDDENGMKLTFTQTGHPESMTDALAKGWQDYYWQPIKAYLEKDS